MKSGGGYLIYLFSSLKIFFFYFLKRNSNPQESCKNSAMNSHIIFTWINPPIVNIWPRLLSWHLVPSLHGK